MGDVIVSKARQKRNFKFVFKKKIFLPSHNYRGEDPGVDRLLYLQAEDETIIQGNIELPDAETAAYLAAISMAVCFGMNLGSTADELLDQGVSDFIALGWREQHDADHWADLVLASREQLIPAEENPEDPDNVQWFINLQWTFVETVSQSPMYGMHWFFCHPAHSKNKQIPELIKALPSNIALAFNCDGVHIFGNDHDCIASYPYADIFRWGGGSGHFSIILGDDNDGSFELCVITSQANDLAAIILDHIQAIMTAGGGDSAAAGEIDDQ